MNNRVYYRHSIVIEHNQHQFLNILTVILNNQIIVTDYTLNIIFNCHDMTNCVILLIGLFLDI